MLASPLERGRLPAYGDFLLRTMKHRIYTTILALCYLWIVLLGALSPEVFSAPKLASAASTPEVGDYACVLETDSYFYASPDESKGLFLLPRTYYVRLLEYGAEYSKVEYLYDDAQVKRVVGYAKTPLLTFVDYVPKRPYFYHVFSLSYRIDETQAQSSDFLNEITVTCAYYGDLELSGKQYCYVLRGETFGYVPKPAQLTVKENTEYAEYLAQQEQAAIEQTPEKKESSPAQIAILVALCLLVPVLAALILKPPRRPPYDIE